MKKMHWTSIIGLAAFIIGTVLSLIGTYKSNEATENRLSAEINHKNDIILPVKSGIHFLGVEIYTTGRRLKKRVWQNAQTKLAPNNVASYRGLIQQHYIKKLPYFDWLITKFL